MYNFQCVSKICQTTIRLLFFISFLFLQNHLFGETITVYVTDHTGQQSDDLQYEVSNVPNAISKSINIKNLGSVIYNVVIEGHNKYPVPNESQEWKEVSNPVNVINTNSSESFNFDPLLQNPLFEYRLKYETDINGQRFTHYQALDTQKIKILAYNPSNAPGQNITPTPISLQSPAIQITPTPTSKLAQSPGGKLTPEASGKSSQIGMIDCVFCIDKSGSMMDNIDMVKSQSDMFLKKLSEFCKANNISCQIGLVTYTRHSDPGEWLEHWKLADDVQQIRSNIFSITITNPNLGGAGNEDTYAAMAFAMDLPVQNKVAAMGWRKDCAKIIMPITDEPPDDPDFEKRTFQDVVNRAGELDPVHVYPLVLPKPALGFLNPAVSSMKKLAAATDGKVTHIEEANKLPSALVETIKVAVERHKLEVWRKENPPYLLYALYLGFGFIIILIALVVLIKAILAKNKLGN